MNNLFNSLGPATPSYKNLQEDMKWLNYQKYESPANHIYPQNPFDSLKQNPLYLPGAFHVGIKF